MEAEYELEDLLNPVSFLLWMTSALETIDLIPSSPVTSSPPQAHPEIFPIDGLGGVPSATPVSMPIRGIKPPFPVLWTLVLPRMNESKMEVASSRPPVFSFGTASSEPSGQKGSEKKHQM